MHDSPYRFAVALLLLAGGSALALSLSAAAGLPASGPADAVVAWHRHLLAVMIGAGLLVAAFVPGIRLAAVAMAIMEKTSFLAVSLAAGSGLDVRQGLEAVVLVALLALMALLAHLARREARWEGAPPLRSQVWEA